MAELGAGFYSLLIALQVRDIEVFFYGERHHERTRHTKIGQRNLHARRSSA